MSTQLMLRREVGSVMDVRGGWGQFEEQDVRGLISRASLQYINMSDSGSRVGAIR
jgi:hypothetical protein